MSVGVILLIVVELIIYFGLAERMINKLGLTRRELLIFFTLMIVGSFIDIPISSSPDITVNVGGALTPVVLAIYILSKADDKIEVIRSLIAVAITGGVIYGLTQIYQFEEGHTFIDSNYLFPIIAGITAYIIGHSRRASFIAGTLGFLIYDLIHLFRITLSGVPGKAAIGGAGIFDSIVISGILAVLLSEIVGEFIERVVSDNKDKEDDKKFSEIFANPDLEFGSLADDGQNKEEEKQEPNDWEENRRGNND
ncbi:MAG: DUF1614 domain-containing protein [Bacillota bacterium]